MLETVDTDVTCEVLGHVHHDGHSLIVHVSVVEPHSQVALFQVPVLREVKGEDGRPVNLRTPSCQNVLPLLTASTGWFSTCMC